MRDLIDQHVPASHRDAVHQALENVFCGEPVSAITRLDGGRSGALICRIEVEAHSYLLRVVTAPNVMNNPARQFATMAIAAANGIAPPVLYSGSDSGIVITEFVDAVPWHRAFDTNPELFALFGRKIRQLHDGAPFPEFVHALQAIDGGLATLRSAGVELPPLFHRFLARFAEVVATLLPHLVMRPCHNDLNPGNLLFDGHALWIIDWESAWQNDPIFDLATLLHWFGFEGERARLLLDGYFGAPPSPHDAAKLELMRQVTHAYYAVVFLLLTLQLDEEVPLIDPAPASLPTFVETRRLLRTGTLPLDSAEARTRFALVMLNDAMQRMEQPDFHAAVSVLRLGG